MVASSRLARGDASVAIGVNMHLVAVLNMERRRQVAVAAGAQRRARAFAASLEQIAHDNVALAAAISERGQDLTRPGTLATRTASGWRIDGRKLFCTMSPAATDLYVAVSYTGSDGAQRYAYAIVPTDAPGVVVHDDWDALGMRASGSNSVSFEGVEVPESGVRGGFAAQSVAINGDTIVSGAPGAVVGFVKKGAAFTFTRTGASARNENGTLSASDGVTSSLLGYSVAIDADTILAGAAEDTIANNVAQGSAYTFSRTGLPARRQTSKLSDTDGATNDFFGLAVALDAGTTVIGTGGPHHVRKADSREPSRPALHKDGRHPPPRRPRQGRHQHHRARRHPPAPHTASNRLLPADRHTHQRARHQGHRRTARFAIAK